MRVSRGELRQMRRQARQHMGSFELKDGKTYFYDTQKAGAKCGPTPWPCRSAASTLMT
jgi:hypothetical protein